MAVLTPSEAAPHLRKAYKEGRLIPFLGAGFSVPLSLPSWRELTGWMAKDVGFEADLFELHGRNEQLAEYFDRIGPRNLQRLIHEMTRRFDSAEAETKRKSSPTHQALARLNWHTLYTTNYDFHLEGALRDAGKQAVVLASFDDFQGPRHPGACEVIKFHGTLEQPETIVLTESSYFQRMALEAPPDQRLRADLLSHGFLFIGYGFNDFNIRYIWYRMHQLRLQSQARRAPNDSGRRSFFATHGPGPVQPKILDEWGIDVIQLDPTDKTASVAELLQLIG
ncbi:SIR2 family protein [Vitiosangium sp. GDMCC 1.1324]|uniref:SIR2 family protein n=1 Tax=Vitiosangium sp. (strain GDMCC 1.1324) TaxID=2138576 RepID=UPI000D38F113|nr:SIR2 family protein [Vitiosangium sp. GDMCC 1.1324]PTL76842.1 SIR2 family protein [Vitiosangium sp. GDMCC 1.1324]